MSRDYIYICDSCDSHHPANDNRQQMVLCETCGGELVLSELDNDGMTDALVCRDYL